MVSLQTFACGTKNHCRARRPVEFKRPGGQAGLPGDRFLFSEKGTALEIAQALGETYEIFDQVIPDPTAELVARGTARLKAFHPDLVVALGGGSPHGYGQSHGVFFPASKFPWQPSPPPPVLERR